MISSEMPSPIQSSVRSFDRFSNGKTRTVLESASRRARQQRVPQPVYMRMRLSTPLIIMKLS